MNREKNSPLVTIGVPLYNEEKYIGESLLSVINQSYKPITIIISDNGSKDKSLDIVNELAAKYPDITVYAQEQNKGPYFNFRFLLDTANTNYFMWFGAHDYMAPDFIENAVKKLEADKTIVEVYPKMGTIIHNEKIPDYTHDDFEVKTNSITDRFLKIIENVNTGSATHGLYRTDVLRKSYIDINGGDLFLFLNAAKEGILQPSDELGYYLREVGRTENPADTDARYFSYGFKKNWRLIHSMYPYEVISSIKGITLKEKLNLLSKARVAMFKFGGRSWKQIFVYHLKKYKLKVAYLALLCKIKAL